MSSSHHPHNSGAQSPLGHHHHHHLQHHHLHLQQQQQQQQQTANNNNSSSNASTPNSNTSFLIKDILRYEGQKRKQRKARTAFSDHQLKELEASFESRKYLTVQDRVKLAHDLKLSDTQVKTWYQNRRTKHKRQTAVGLELLNDVNHFYAYQSALQQSGAQWLLSHCAAPSTQLNFAAAAAVLAAQAAHAQAVSPQQQQQVAAAQAAHSLAGHQSAASVIKPALSPQHSPQDHRLLDGSSDSSK